MIALTPNQTWDYVPRQDRELPAAKQTVFRLRALSKREKHELHNLRTRPGVFTGTEGDVRYQTLRAGLAGWSNFLDAAGNPVAFETEKDDVEVYGRRCRPATIACLDRVTDELEIELVTEILTGSNLNHEDRKNSPSPQA